MKKESVKIDYVLVCEDIRMEIGNKPSAMGIFTDDVHVVSFPYTFPKLCFMVHGIYQGPTRRVTVNLVARFPQLAPIVIANNQELVFTNAPGGFVMNLAVGPLVLTAPGPVALEMDFGIKKIVHRFALKKANVPILVDPSGARRAN